MQPTVSLCPRSWWTKHLVCKDVGITYENVVLPASASPEDLKAAIMELNTKPNVHAILIERGLKANMTSAVAGSVNYLSELIRCLRCYVQRTHYWHVYLKLFCI